MFLRALLGIEPRPLAVATSPKASIVPLDYKASYFDAQPENQVKPLCENIIRISMNRNYTRT